MQTGNTATAGALGPILASSITSFALSTSLIPRYRTNTNIQLHMGIFDLFGNKYNPQVSMGTRTRD